MPLKTRRCGGTRASKAWEYEFKNPDDGETVVKRIEGLPAHAGCGTEVEAWIVDADHPNDRVFMPMFRKTAEVVICPYCDRAPTKDGLVVP